MWVVDGTGRGERATAAAVCGHMGMLRARGGGAAYWCAPGHGIMELCCGSGLIE